MSSARTVRSVENGWEPRTKGRYRLDIDRGCGAGGLARRRPGTGSRYGRTAHQTAASCGRRKRLPPAVEIELLVASGPRSPNGGRHRAIERVGCHRAGVACGLNIQHDCDRRADPCVVVPTRETARTVPASSTTLIEQRALSAAKHRVESIIRQTGASIQLTVDLKGRRAANPLLLEPLGCALVEQEIDGAELDATRLEGALQGFAGSTKRRGVDRNRSGQERVSGVRCSGARGSATGMIDQILPSSFMRR